MNYIERAYRNRVSGNWLSSFCVIEKETDLHISSDGHDLKGLAIESIRRHRNILERYIRNHSQFLTSLVPLPTDTMAPMIVKDMVNAVQCAGVGPMASVAGAIAEYVGYDLLNECSNVIVENGGDVFIKLVEKEISVGIFAGESPLSYKVALKITPEETPLGICTSSATVGHSISFGTADAVCIKSKSALLADAAATAVCNSIKCPGDIKTALHKASDIKGVLGVVIIAGNKMGASGDIEFV